MPDTMTPLPAMGSRCWRDQISPETGATVLSLAAETPEDDPMVELAYDEGSRGWWPLSTLVFEQT
ncbi:hypothetical protein KBZ20_17325 [Vulcanococcus limneticus Candia 3F8]|uniref:hypothetical protein n=1 Tax=Vulcanococcus limneticus TaxID=2170428 RepID=UPI0020CC4D14|nr:hypothetical protein [Vulcanococcus limneticus]MCP9895524.1 hypothetical protein [Vulcanococcus limneticus Candia 3F8]